MTCLTSGRMSSSSQMFGSYITKNHSSPYVRCQALVKVNEHLLVFGLGYTGRAVANTLSKSGWKRIVQALRHATYILCTIPPSPQDTLAAELVLAHAAPGLRWVGYLSSTSVYGDWGGSWVDERFAAPTSVQPNLLLPCSSELRLTSSKCIQRAEAEAAWLRLHHNHGLPAHIFRLGGIYGPGRSALDAAKQKGAASASQQRRGLQQYTARCHVQDICKALSASMRKPNPGSIYNVVDDDPSGRAIVIAFAAKLLQTQQRSPVQGSSASANDDAVNLLQVSSLPVFEPSQQQPQTGPESGSSGISQVVTGGSRAEKRVCNAKIKSELLLALDFPSYREGLAAIHAGNRCPFD